MQQIHRVIKTTTDKVPGELDVVEFLGGLVLSVAYAGGRDWIIIVRGHLSWKVTGDALKSPSVVAWLRDQDVEPAAVTQVEQMDDGTARIWRDSIEHPVRIDPDRPVPLGGPPPTYADDVHIDVSQHQGDPVLLRWLTDNGINPEDVPVQLIHVYNGKIELDRYVKEDGRRVVMAVSGGAVTARHRTVRPLQAAVPAALR